MEILHEAIEKNNSREQGLGRKGNNRVGENQTWKIGSPSGSEDATTGVKFRSRRPGKLSPESWTETESCWPRQSSGQLQEVLGHVGWPLTRSGLGNDQCGEQDEDRVLGRKGASLHQRYAPTHDQRFWLNWSGEGPWHWYFFNIFWVITGLNQGRIRGMWEGN